MSIRKDKQFMKILRDYHRLVHNMIPGASCLLDIMSKEDELVDYVDNYLDDVVLQRDADQIRNELVELHEKLRTGTIFHGI